MRFFLLLTAAAFAAPAAAEDVKVTLGLGGAVRLGDWTAIAVDGVDGEATAHAPDANGQTVVYPLTPNAGSRHVGTILIGRLDAEVDVRVDGRSVRQARIGPDEDDFATPILWARPIWATDGGSELAAVTAERLTAADFETGPHVVTVDPLDDDPFVAKRLAAADAFVLTAAPSDAMAAALRDWTAAGGHLIVSFGDPDGEDWSAFLGWSPVRASGVRTYRQLSALESAIPGGRRLTSRRGVRGTELSSEGGVVSIDSLQGPIVLRSAYGLGRVTALAIDLTDEAVAEWESLSGLGLVLTESRVRTTDKRRRNALTKTGVTEVQTQLIAAIDSPPAEAGRPESWEVLGLLALYAAAVGFLDRFLVAGLLRRPQWTWFTLPAWVLAGCWFAAAYTGEVAAGGETVRRLTVLDAAADTRTARGNSWAAVGSSSLSRKTLTAGRPLGGDDWSLGWAAPPEGNFGGLYRVGGASSPLQYAAGADRHAVEGLPFRPLGSRVLRTSWSGETPAPLTADLKSDGIRVTGTITNNLDAPLSDWVAGFGSTLVSPLSGEPLAPGETFTVDARTTRQSTLRESVTGTRTLLYEDDGKKEKEVRTRTARNDYDATDADLTRVLRIATFFGAAGGYEYARVRASTPRGLDLTPLLALDRMIVVGRIEADAAPLSAGGEPLPPGETFLRVVLPVRPPRVVE